MNETADQWLKLPAPDAISVQVQLLKMLGVGVKHENNQ